MGYICKLEKHKYDNGRLALCLVDHEDGSPVATITVNMPQHKLEENEVFIKNHSENEGTLEALEEHGLIEEVTDCVASGFVLIPKVKLNMKELELYVK